MTVHEHYVFSQGGYPIGCLDTTGSYWAVKLDDGKWLCELDQVNDLLIGKRRLDWTLDIASTGDWRKIVELWMICPSTPTSPGGNTVRLPITSPGTAFQFKVGFVDSSLTTSVRRTSAQIIGRVTDEETGECEAFVFDYDMQGLIPAWKTNVHNMGTWKPSIVGQPQVAPITMLSFDVLGLHFGDRAGV